MALVSLFGRLVARSGRKRGNRQTDGRPTLAAHARRGRSYLVYIRQLQFCSFFNPRRACAARVTVVGSVCTLCVCLLSHISPKERLFVLKTLSRTQRATKVKKFVGFSLKPLRCRDPALPPLYGHAYSRPFFSCTRMRISRVIRA